MKSHKSILLGASFLMATSAIGPGFLTQTTYYTNLLLNNFGFVIICSIVIDISAQMTIWRVLTSSNMRAQDFGNKLLPRLGTLLAVLVGFGGLVFNTGNLAGSGMGLNALFQVENSTGAIISSIIAVVVFLSKDSLKYLDYIVKVLGFCMIIILLFLVFKAKVNYAEMLLGTFWPTSIDLKATVTLVGGTVGGYITFAGAHRLIDAGITGPENLKEVSLSAVTGIVFTGFLRYFLFWGTLGVVLAGVTLNKENPTGSVFLFSFGKPGLLFYGIIIWAASISSVMGATYTSVSFFKTLSKWISFKTEIVSVVFILISLAILVLVGKPVKLLLLAGYINGFILPLGLAMILLGYRILNVPKSLPLLFEISSWLVVIIMGTFAILSLIG